MLFTFISRQIENSFFDGAKHFSLDLIKTWQYSNDNTFLALKWIWRIFENCLKVELSLSTTLIIHWIKTKLKFLICSNCRDKEDWHRPDLFRPTVQMWLTQAAAESGRLRVQPAAVRVRRLLLHLMKDLYHQLRLLTSPVSLYCHSSFSAQQITSSTYRH